MGRIGLYFLASLAILFSLSGCSDDKFVATPVAIPGDVGLEDLGGEGDGGGERKDAAYRYFSADDSFTGAFTQKQDFLFVVDNSGSMGEEIAAVKAGLNQFVATLDTARAVDYQIAVVTTNIRLDVGQLRSSSTGISVVKRASTLNPVAVAQDILSHIEAGKSQFDSDERGLQAAELAIKNGGSYFMRPDVPLAVMILSDEEDHSCPFVDRSCNASEFYATTYFTSFFKGLANPILLYPIVGKPGSTTCTNASGGERYRRAQVELGAGLSGDICTDSLGPAFNQIAATLSARGICYKLAKEATGKDILVKVNNASVVESPTDGYRFDAGTNSICFSGSRSTVDGDVIKVTYEAKELIQ